MVDTRLAHDAPAYMGTLDNVSDDIRQLERIHT
jgi:hypothetical protein